GLARALRRERVGLREHTPLLGVRAGLDLHLLGRRRRAQLDLALLGLRLRDPRVAVGLGRLDDGGLEPLLGPRRLELRDRGLLDDDTLARLRLGERARLRGL